MHGPMKANAKERQERKKGQEQHQEKAREEKKPREYPSARLRGLLGLTKKNF